MSKTMLPEGVAIFRKPSLARLLDSTDRQIDSLMDRGQLAYCRLGEGVKAERVVLRADLEAYLRRIETTRRVPPAARITPQRVSS